MDQLLVHCDAFVWNPVAAKKLYVGLGSSMTEAVVIPNLDSGASGDWTARIARGFSDTGRRGYQRWTPPPESGSP